jgi:D-tyrosyl-tRNA(Tyr) deacylase
LTACVQRVLSAGVEIDGNAVAKTEKGLLILLGVKKGDTADDASYLARKCCSLRIFSDENGKMNLSCGECGGELLIVTNFTLCGDCAKGKRPSFDNAERPEPARALAEFFTAECKKTGLRVETGEFGADMKVSLVNDGPVTLILDTDAMRKNNKI